MPDFSSLIETGAEYQISFLFSGGTPYVAQTIKDFDTNDAVAVEEIFAVGNSTAIGLKKNNYSYKGSFTMQSGEVAALCVALGVPSLVKANQITSFMLFGINVKLVENYIDVLIVSQDKNVTSTSKETPVKIAFMARDKQ
jgi:hypothetical protein